MSATDPQHRRNDPKRVRRIDIQKIIPLEPRTQVEKKREIEPEPSRQRHQHPGERRSEHSAITYIGRERRVRQRRERNEPPKLLQDDNRVWIREDREDELADLCFPWLHQISITLDTESPRVKVKTITGVEREARRLGIRPPDYGFDFEL